MFALLKYARGPSSFFGNEVLEDGATHLKMLEAMKKEFKLNRIHWRQIYDHVAGVDELNMSVMRLRLRFEDEPVTSQVNFVSLFPKFIQFNSIFFQGALTRKNKPKGSGPDLATREADKFETIFILEEHELPAQKLKLMTERTVAASEFRKRHGQLLYLENLKSSDYGTKGGGENPELCPVCRNCLGTQWSVLQVNKMFVKVMFFLFKTLDCF